MKDINTPLWQITIGELIEFLNSNSKIITTNIPESNDSLVFSNNKHAHGIVGLAKILGCSKTHAQRLKSSGLFDPAIIQNGRKIIIDKEEALKLFNNKHI